MKDGLRVFGLRNGLGIHTHTGKIRERDKVFGLRNGLHVDLHHVRGS